MDRAYLDFYRLYEMHRRSAFFISREKRKTKIRRLYSATVYKSTGVLYDQTVRPSGQDTAEAYPEKLRRIIFHDSKTNKRLIFLTNNFLLDSEIIAKLYKYRWQVELFFKWIKQHLRIKKFFGYSENALNTHVWIAISVYVLVAIIKKRLFLEQRLYEILQMLSIALFEKEESTQLFSEHYCEKEGTHQPIQLNLFDI